MQKLHLLGLFRIVKDDYNGHFKVFKGQPGPSMEKIALIRVVNDHYDGRSNVFLDRQGHLGEIHCHLGAFGTFKNAREASGAQRCECL